MILIKLVYFLLLGWWLGAAAASLGYLLCVSIIGLPFGVLLINRLPTIMWLKDPDEIYVPDYGWAPKSQDIPFLLRVLWFFLVGWTLGFFAISVGYFLMVTIIGIPLGIYVLNRVPLLLTLSRHYN